jgi:S1-C subfamily serine protease
MVGLGALGLGILRQPEASAISSQTAESSFNDSVGRVVAANGNTCTGTIIKSSLFMTAEHCNVGEGAKVTFFEYDGGTKSPITGEIRDVRKHPNRDFVMSRVFFSSTASLPGASELNFETQDAGSQVTVIGYGITGVEDGEAKLAEHQLKGVGQIARELTGAGSPGVHYQVTDVEICGGDSGGPVLDSDGRVVAISLSREGSAGGCGRPFALKLNEVKDFIDATIAELGPGI